MSSAYRLSDAERNEAIEALSDAYVDGRLGGEEFEERMAQASGAVHAADLDPLFADLPPRPTRRVERNPRPAARRRIGPPPQLFALLPLALVLAAVSLGAWWLLFAIPLVMGFAGGRRGPWHPQGGQPWMAHQRCGAGRHRRRW